MEGQEPEPPAEHVQKQDAAPANKPPASANGNMPGHRRTSAGTSEAGLPPLHKQSSNMASKIAAFSSGVAPVRKGITNADEDSITVEDVLYKLETASRATQDKTDLPVPLVRSAHQHLVAAREEAAKTAKELAELKASRVQHIPPSTWIKREQKYKMDQEKYEHTLTQLRQRIERLEMELQVLREGSNVRPLEEKIQELEQQLVAAAAEKTKVQSKFHELSIKHRQLIETSPQVATIWNEVMVQQAADGHNAAAMQRLCNFDLRHTAVSSSLSSRPADAVSVQQLPGVSAAAAAFSHGTSIPLPVSSAIPGTAAASHADQAGPSTPMQQPPSTSSPVAPAEGQQQSAEERAQALMAAVALEGLSPEASLAALQQLNYDLTMQLGVYQQMVTRLKDAMEQSDLEKAELEADKTALELQLAAAGGSGAAAHAGLGPMAESSGSAGSTKSSARGWGGFFRRSMGLSSAGPHEDHDEVGSMADTASLAGIGSLASSRHSSMELDAATTAALTAAATAATGGGGSGSNSSTPTVAATEAAAAAAAAGAEGSSEDGGTATAVATPAQPPQQASSSSSGGGLFAARRARAAARAAAAVESLSKEVKELKRQVKSLQDENKYLVNNLVEIKMELAETQGNHDQAKRALIRAMDKEACLDLKVSELTHMLDMATNLNQQNQQRLSSLPEAAAAAASAMAAAVVSAASAVASGGTPTSARAAKRAEASPFGPPPPPTEDIDARTEGVDADSSKQEHADATTAAAAAPTAAASDAASSTDAAADAADAAGPPEVEQAAVNAEGADLPAAVAAAAAGDVQQVASFQLTDSSSYEEADEDNAKSDDSTEEPAAASDAPATAAADVPAADTSVTGAEDGSTSSSSTLQEGKVATSKQEAAAL